jgi:hypothetical protein
LGRDEVLSVLARIVARQCVRPMDERTPTALREAGVCVPRRRPG